MTLHPVLSGIRRFFCCVALMGFCSYAWAKKSDHVWFSASDGGIYHSVFNAAKGVLSTPRQVVNERGSEYLVQHPTQPILYSIEGMGKETNLISYRIQSDGSLKEQSRLVRPLMGAAHISIHPSGQMIAVAYYVGGATGVYALKKSGEITGVVMENKHTGGSVHRKRQKAPHPHWSGFSQDGRFLYIPDLGNDQIWVYAVDIENGQAAFAAKVKTPKGGGPRHLAFHPTKPWAYVTDELIAGVSAYNVNTEDGLLQRFASYNGAGQETDELWANVSDLRIHPNGRFLYVVNRGFDQVAVFAIHQKTGELTPVEREPIRGSISRNMVVTKDGNWAMVAGSRSHTVTVFKLDAKSGAMYFIRNQNHFVPDVRSIVVDGYAN